MSEWGKYDALAFSGDCGRIGFEEDPWEINVCCPQIIFNGKVSARPNMSARACIIRVEMRNIACLSKCDFAKKLKKHLDNNPEA